MSACLPVAGTNTEVITTMKTRVVLPLVTLMLTTCATAFGADAPETPDAIKAQLKQQADRWDVAIIEKRRDDIAANMADEFRQISGAGKLADKPAFIDGLMDPKLHIDPYGVEDFDIRLYGDVALLSGRTHMTGTYAGEPFASDYRYIDVYVRDGEQWRVVSVQITPLGG